VYEHGKAFVMVKKGSRVQKRPVEMGARSLTLTVIKKGLEAGEAILLGTMGATAKEGKPQ
jgi:hypothetical protein